MIERLHPSDPPAGTAGLRLQHAALCYRLDRGRVRVLMVTTRRARHWILPRGWPIGSLGPAGTAACEAWEEAGVRGTPDPDALGCYTYCKGRRGARGVPILVSVHVLRVREVYRNFPEKGQRRRKWVSPKKAAARVREPDLARLLRGFEPRRLH